MRPSSAVMEEKRVCGPLRKIPGRLVTAAARAILDAAVHAECCTAADLSAAVAERGRRSIVHVRELVQLADGRAESPMESEARLVFLDGGLPLPDLQYEIIDPHGNLCRV